jgi:hypothetical protein
MLQVSLEPKQSAALKRSSYAPVAMSHRLHPVLRLQRAIGNQALAHLLQAKLSVSEPGDIYEQEADRITDLVMRSAAVPAKSQAGSPAKVQLKSAPVRGVRKSLPGMRRR